MNHHGKSPREMAAMAAMRRMRDSQTCATAEAADAVDAPEAGPAAAPAPTLPVPPKKRASLPDESAGAAKRARAIAVEVPAQKQPVAEWPCPACTLVNRPLWLQCDACGTERPL